MDDLVPDAGPGMTAEMGVVASVRRVKGLGMVMVRADFAAAGDAIAEAAGLPLPGVTRITTDGSRSLGWMSPDELLLVLPVEDTAQAVTALRDALASEHALVADVSDMRCVFDVTGAAPEQVLAKLSPTDFDALAPDALRRTRLAQVAAAFWRVPDGFRVVAMRSVEGYVQGILTAAAAPGTWLDPR